MITTLMIMVDVTDPIVVLVLWAGVCLAALVAALLLAAALRAPLAADIAPPGGAHAVGQVDEIEDDTDRPGPRHSGIGVRRWTPQHTAEAAVRRGRHHTGDRYVVLSLVDTQVLVTVDELDEAMADRGAR